MEDTNEVAYSEGATFPRVRRRADCRGIRGHAGSDRHYVLDCHSGDRHKGQQHVRKSGEQAELAPVGTRMTLIVAALARHPLRSFSGKQCTQRKRVYVHPTSPISTLLYTVQVELADVRQSLKNTLFAAFSGWCTGMALLPYESRALTAELRAQTVASACASTTPDDSLSHRGLTLSS